MSDKKHDKALDLTEEALGKMVEGDEAAAERLIRDARKIDESAPKEVLDDLDEDAANRSKAGHSKDR